MVLSSCMNVFLIHGSNGSPNVHWFPWLERELEQKGHNVIAPQFPVQGEQTLENWLQTLKPHADKLEGSIMVGHSLGVPFILRALEHFNVNAKHVILVGGFTGELDVDEPNLHDFSVHDFPWEQLKKQAGKATIFHGTDDPLVPLEKIRPLADALEADVHLIPKGGHLRAQDGFAEFPHLLEAMEL